MRWLGREDALVEMSGRGKETTVPASGFLRLTPAPRFVANQLLCHILLPIILDSHV